MVSITAQDWASGRIDKHDGANVTHSAEPKCFLIDVLLRCGIGKRLSLTTPVWEKTEVGLLALV